MMRIAPDSLRAKDPYPDAHMFMALWSLYGGIDGDEAFVPPMHLDEVHNSMVESGYKTPEGRQTDLGRAVWDSIPVRFAGGVETVSGHTLYVAVIRGADPDLLDRIGSDCILGENTGGLSVSGARDAEEAAAVGFAMGSCRIREGDAVLAVRGDGEDCVERMMTAAMAVASYPTT